MQTPPGPMLAVAMLAAMWDVLLLAALANSLVEELRLAATEYGELIVTLALMLPIGENAGRKTLPSLPLTLLLGAWPPKCLACYRQVAVQGF
jgi:hypothetical protein